MFRQVRFDGASMALRPSTLHQRKRETHTRLGSERERDVLNLFLFLFLV